MTHFSIKGYIVNNNIILTPLKSTFIGPASLILFLITQPAFSECNRSDVDHYLDKGFTTTQIAAICSDSTPQTPSAASTIPETLAASLIENGTEKKLKSLINGKQISLSDDLLKYTQEICFSYEYDEYYPPQQVVCPQVQVSISRENLKVIKTENLILDGDQVVVTGSIIMKPLDSYEEKAPEERKLINAAFGDTNTTNITLRHKASATELAELLHQISR